MRDYGALGNGKPDDTATIQKAIDAAKLGQTVLFPEGTYIVTSVFDEGLYIKGDSKVHIENTRNEAQKPVVNE